MQKDIVKILKKGGVGVIPTDTMYGIVGSAFSKDAVLRVYDVKQRDLAKPLIVLISDFVDLKKLGVRLSKRDGIEVKRFWPGKVSIILPCLSQKMAYLHRGTKTLAIRFPNEKKVISLLKKTGPLVAPSANPEGKLPSKTISQAKKYFGKKVDFYLNAGTMDAVPSTLILLKGGKAKVVRIGAQEIIPKMQFIKK